MVLYIYVTYGGIKMDFREIKEFLSDTFKYIIVIILVLILAIYVISLSQVVGNSMSPNYNDGDVVFVSKIHYKISTIQRNDIISFKKEDTRYLIKRVIGLPGEIIEYKDNTLYIDGVGYDELYLDKSTKTNNFSLNDLGYTKIPDDMYLVLGDNREDSYDSRDFGLIKKSDIIGKCIFQLWPLNKIKKM